MGGGPFAFGAFQLHGWPKARRVGGSFSTACISGSPGAAGGPDFAVPPGSFNGGRPGAGSGVGPRNSSGWTIDDAMTNRLQDCGSNHNNRGNDNSHNGHGGIDPSPFRHVLARSADGRGRSTEGGPGFSSTSKWEDRPFGARELHGYSDTGRGGGGYNNANTAHAEGAPGARGRWGDAFIPVRGGAGPGPASGSSTDFGSGFYKHGDPGPSGRWLPRVGHAPTNRIQHYGDLRSMCFGVIDRTCHLDGWQKAALKGELERETNNSAAFGAGTSSGTFSSVRSGETGMYMMGPLPASHSIVYPRGAASASAAAVASVSSEVPVSTPERSHLDGSGGGDGTWKKTIRGTRGGPRGSRALAEKRAKRDAKAKAEAEAEAKAQGEAAGAAASTPPAGAKSES